MILELLTIGNELLDGRRVDTNTAWLGRQCRSLGILPRYRQTMTDQHQDIAQAFVHALSRSDVVVVTGGLGPTQDDVTFEALAQAFDLDLVFHEPVAKQIQKKFQARGLRCPESNFRQAKLPKGAQVLKNPDGTAPGCRLEVGEKLIFCLPGVPSEMERIFSESVAPELAKRLGIQNRLEERVYQFSGLPESFVEEYVEAARLAEIPKAQIRVAYTSSFPIIEVALAIHLEEGASIKTVQEEIDQRLKKKLGSYLVTIGTQTLQSHVLDLLKEKGLRLAVAESMTGGLVAAKIVEVPGSSEVFDRSWVVYSNQAKIEELDISSQTLCEFGAVSPQCALEMAQGALARSEGSVALSTTGIAGPDGATPSKPVGLTYIAWVGPGFEEVREFQFRWERNRNRLMASFEALKGLVRHLQNAPGV